VQWLLCWLVWLGTRRWPARVIPARDNKDLYLTRYYLLGGPDTEGMEHHGNKAGWGLYLHHFHRSDDAGDLHNHPWKWSISFILRGGYWEDRVDGRRFRAPWTFNFIRNSTFHRVDLAEKDAWTLFFAGPRVGSWGFKDAKTDRFVPWRKYLGLQD
jgi:hypothetical protein